MNESNDVMAIGAHLAAATAAEGRDGTMKTQVDYTKCTGRGVRVIRTQAPLLGDAWRRPVVGAASSEAGRQRPCHGEPVPIDLRFQLHQATHLETDHLGLL